MSALTEPTRSTRAFERLRDKRSAELRAFVRSRAGNSRAKRQAAIERASMRPQPNQEA